MCRIIAYAGVKPATLEPIFELFRQGSQCDPRAREALGDKYTCHPDGWGLALYDGEQLHHFRSKNPVWEDAFTLPKLAGDRVWAIFHSRLATRPELNSPVCSHPFINSNDREILLLAHNGAVDIDTAPGKGPGQVVDSEWALARITADGGLPESLDYLKGRVCRKSALNLALMTIPRDKALLPALHCLNFYRTEAPERGPYYRMSTGDYLGGRVFLHDTFKDLCPAGLSNVQPAPFGEVFPL